MLAEDQFDPGRARRHLTANTFSFAVCVAVWTIFSVIGVQIQNELGLNDSELGLLLATPILTGSVSRFFLGMLTEQLGGRPVFTIVMLASAASTWLLTMGDSYVLYLVAGLGIGLAGGSFIVGIAYTSEMSRRHSPIRVHSRFNNHSPEDPMTEIVDFDSFLEIAQASDEPQRLLFIFLKVALPEDATEEERQRYEQGNGGGLMPVMYVDKSPGEITDFSGLVEESRAMGEDWHMVLAAALVGEGGPPTDSAVEEAFSGLIKTVHAGGDLSSMLAFDREGDPVIFN